LTFPFSILCFLEVICLEVIFLPVRQEEFAGLPAHSTRHRPTYVVGAKPISRRLEGRKAHSLTSARSVPARTWAWVIFPVGCILHQRAVRNQRRTGQSWLEDHRDGAGLGSPEGSGQVRKREVYL
jgi:hypothetical protein